MVATINTSKAQEMPNYAKEYADEFQKLVEIPTEYHFHSMKKVKIENVSAYLFRYEKNENKNLIGEHFSFLISEKDRTILGFTNMDRKYTDTNLLSKAETEKIARDFMKKTDPKLEKQLKNLWIEPHDEIIEVNGTKTKVTAMKYKCFRSENNDYAWVCVGFDGSVQTFERNVKWDNQKSVRIAEKWLHDSWRTENDKL